MRVPYIGLAAALAIAGCGDATRTVTEPAAPAPKRDHAKRARASHCPPSAANCRTARGRVVYVEAVDPDGEGDAHFVLASRDSITGPGIAVIDVERNMRPRHLPKTGDEVTAAGPVYRGSHGQRQIQATELHIARR